MSHSDSDDPGPEDEDSFPHHRDTDRVVLPSPSGAHAPPFHIPAAPGVPRLGPDENTQPPGAYPPPTPTEDPVVTGVRNAVRELVEPLKESVAGLHDEWREWSRGWDARHANSLEELGEVLFQRIVKFFTPHVDNFLSQIAMQEKAIEAIDEQHEQQAARLGQLEQRQKTVEDDLESVRGSLQRLEERLNTLIPDGR